MTSNTEFKLLLETLDSSRLFSICHFLTAQCISDCPGSVNDTEQQSIAIFVVEKVINTLLNCIINKTRKLV